MNKIYEIAQQYAEVKNIPIEAFMHEYNTEYIGEVRKTAEKLVDRCFKESKTIKNIDLDNPPNAQVLFDMVIKEGEYLCVAKSIFEEEYKKYIEKKKKEKSAPFFFPRLPDFNELLKPSMPDLSKMMSREDMEKERIKLEKYSNYKDYINVKEAEIDNYKDIITKKEKLLELSQEIPNLKTNLYLLFIFSLLGVFLPLYMLILDEKTMIENRFLILFLMFIGWLFIVINIRLEIQWLINANPLKSNVNQSNQSQNSHESINDQHNINPTKITGLNESEQN